MDCIPEDKPSAQCSERCSAIVQTLATELLREIFLNCLPNPSVYRYSMRNLSQAPLLIGRVCRRWRDVANYSPELWSSFVVGGAKVNLGKDLEATKYWISKSSSQPLSIVMDYLETYSDDTELRPILESVVSQSWRWREIDLRVPSGFFDIALAAFCTGKLPQLVRFDSITSGPGYREFILSSAPRLHSMRYSGDRARVDFSGGTHGIRRIEINPSQYSKISLGDLLTCFTQCPLLESATLPIHIGEWKSSLSDRLPTTIQLPRLTYLFLDFGSNINPCRIFDLLFLPALISLKLTVHIRNVDHADWTHVWTMLAHSDPPLRTLVLRCVPMTEQTLLECLSCIPSLTKLQVEGILCSDNVLRTLTMDETNGNAPKSLCPWLETFDFWYNRDKCHFSEGAVTEMVVSRRKTAKSTDYKKGMALKVFACPFSFSGLRVHPDIAECINEGLVLMGSD